MLKKLVMLLSLCCSSISLFSISSETLKVNAENQKESIVAPETYYTTLNGYNYDLAANFNDSVDSFEAWVKLPVASIGGTIVGNFCEPSYPYNTVNWKVNAAGHFGFDWNDKAISYTFDDTKNIADNTWHHVALVRTDTEFTYYLDGELASVYEIETEPCISTIPFSIGVDKSCWRVTKSPLEGYVRQVTFYNGAISAEQIKKDMENTAITAEDTISSNATILGNWDFGAYWTERVIESSVEGAPKANLYTFEKYVGADYSFGEYDYTFVIVPDIQIMGNYNVPRLNNQIQWLVDNQEKHNIEFAMFVGDLSDFGQKEELYQVAANAMDKLNNKIPYCFVPGNHDYDDNASTRGQVYFNRHFSTEKHSQLPGFGGVYQEGSMANSYYEFKAEDIDYLVINLEYHPRLSVLRWANRVIEAHPRHRVIVETHDYVNPNNTFVQSVSAGYEANGSQKIFDALISKHENVFLAVGGHHCYDDTVYRTDKGVNGNKILSMLIDGQGTKYKGDGAQDMLMLVHVNEAKKTMNFVYYSPEKGKVWNLQNQYQISFADEFNPTIGK